MTNSDSEGTAPTAKRLDIPFPEAVTAAIATGGIYLLAWCFEYGYAHYFKLPWPAPVALSRYCTGFVVIASLLSLVYFIPHSEWAERDMDIKSWSWSTHFQVGGAIVLVGFSIGTFLKAGFPPNSLAVAIVMGAAFPGVWLSRQAISSKFSLPARASLLGLATLVLCYAAYIGGQVVASKIQTWPTFEEADGSSWVVIEQHDGDLITAKLDRDNHSFEPTFTIRPATDCPPLKRETIARLHPHTKPPREQ